MSDLYWLTDGQMARLKPYFPKGHGKPRVDDRRVLSGIVFVNRDLLPIFRPLITSLRCPGDRRANPGRFTPKLPLLTNY